MPPLAGPEPASEARRPASTVRQRSLKWGQAGAAPADRTAVNARRERRRTRGGRGAALLELALIAPALATIAMGTVEATTWYRTAIELENAAREGGAYAALHPADVDCPDQDDVIDHVVREHRDLVALEDLTVQVLRISAGDAVPIVGCGTATVGAGEIIRVEVSAHHVILTPLVRGIVGSRLRMSGTHEVRVQG